MEEEKDEVEEEVTNRRFLAKCFKNLFCFAVTEVAAAESL